MARDLKFTETRNNPPWGHLRDRIYQHDACTLAARTYSANIFRMLTLNRLVSAPFLYGRIYQEAEQRVIQAGVAKTQEGIDLRARANFYSMAQAGSIQERSANDRHAAALSEEILSFIAPIHKALETMLEVMIIQAWTAFEVLVKDLWDRSLAQGLKSIVAPTPQERNDNKMGFGSRYRFRNAYKFVFSRDNTAMMNLLCDQTIDALSVTRNVFVHASGFVDEDFMKQSDGVTILLPLRNLGVGAPVELTGAIVRSLIDPVTFKGYDLLLEVDQWMTRNKS